MEVPVVTRSQNIWSTRGRSEGVLDAGITPIQKKYITELNFQK